MPAPPWPAWRWPSRRCGNSPTSTGCLPVGDRRSSAPRRAHRPGTAAAGAAGAMAHQGDPAAGGAARQLGSQGRHPIEQPRPAQEKQGEQPVEARNRHQHHRLTAEPLQASHQRCIGLSADQETAVHQNRLLRAGGLCAGRGCAGQESAGRDSADWGGIGRRQGCWAGGEAMFSGPSPQPWGSCHQAQASRLISTPIISSNAISATWSPRESGTRMSASRWGMLGEGVDHADQKWVRRQRRQWQGREGWLAAQAIRSNEPSGIRK